MSTSNCFYSVVAILALSSGCIFGGSAPMVEDTGTVDAGNNGTDSGSELCGNEVVDPGETCDGDCAASCDDGDPCTNDSREGAQVTCDVVCTNEPILGCGGDMGTPTDMSMTDTGSPVELEGFVVFNDELVEGAAYAPFADSRLAPEVTTSEAASGTSSLMVSVPDAGFTGGAYTTPGAVDLAQYNVLRFLVKASQEATLNVAGFGNTGAEASRYVERFNIPVTTEWEEVIIPLPDPSVMLDHQGLFHFAEGSDEGGYEIYFDEIVYQSLDASELTNPAPRFRDSTVTLIPGQTTAPVETSLAIEVRDTLVGVTVAPYYFEWLSSNTTVGRVDDEGTVLAVGLGNATITGSLAGVTSSSALDILVVDEPQTRATTPTLPVSNVVASLFSDAYPQEPVDGYAVYSSSGATVTQILLSGDNVLKYEMLGYAATTFEGANIVDLSGATMMHIDVWTTNPSVGFKLVDFGADNAYDDPADLNDPFVDDSEARLAFTAPDDYVTGTWKSFDIPLTDFETAGLKGKANLAQFLIDAAPQTDATIFVDNIYFY